VERPHGRAGAPRLQGTGDALVGGQPPGRGGGVVDGAAQEGVPEAEPAPVAGRADEVGRDQAVQRHERVGGFQARGRGGQLRVERVAGHGRAVEQRARRGRQRADLELDGGQQRRRQRALGVAGDARQLLEEERVAGGLASEALAQARVGHVADQLERRGVGKRGEGDEPAAGGAGRVQDARRGLDGPQGEGEQVRRAGGAAQEVQDQLDRGVVGPVEVVEQQGHRPLAREQLQQCAEGAVAAEALAGARCRRRGARERRRRRQRRGQVGADGLDAAGMHRRDVVVERIHHEPERDVALVLGRAAVEDEQAGGPRAPGQGVQERALADPGLPEHGEHAALALTHGGHGAIRGGQLALASYEAGAGAHAGASAPVGVSASSPSMVATSPSQPEKSMSLPSAAVMRPVRASSATCSSSARLIIRRPTDGSIHGGRPQYIEGPPKPPPPTLP
jgi:hypothetical protein